TLLGNGSTQQGVLDLAVTIKYEIPSELGGASSAPPSRGGQLGRQTTGTVCCLTRFVPPNPFK
ncbi:hypothetical protein, partial [Cupriavidus gilardii]|uniref:hypothetical protein n=1 Tax=Cupriavidus gilardii TaxID=82541 RepID=UPI0031DA3C0B